MEIQNTRKRTVMRARTTLLVLLTAALLSACRSREEMPFSTDPVENIEALWQIIDTKYCYVESKGIDWQAIHDEYAAKAFDRSYNTAWYDSYPDNYNSGLLRNYLKDYRIAESLYYCTIDNGNVGYVYYSSFSNAFGGSNIRAVLNAFNNCKGLIIDVRNNGGGDITNAYKLAAPFFTNSQAIGYWQHKTGPGHNDFSEMETMNLDASLISAKWDKPVVVLCNRRSYSATNLYVSMMRYAPNATIVGGVSGGGGGMPMSYELPCGWMVRFSSIRMYDLDKNDIEEGIEPDVPVTLQSENKDDIIEKAIELINAK